MDYQLNTRLNGNIAMTSRFHESKPLQRDKTLYKFLWVQGGTLTVEVDHIPMKLEKDEIITLTPLHHLDIKEVEGEYLAFVFNLRARRRGVLQRIPVLRLVPGDAVEAVGRAVVQPARHSPDFPSGVRR